MRIRALVISTAILSSLIGGTVVYLLLSVPNDLAADSLLQTARKDIAAGKHEEARSALGKILQQYPRTDAAAAATLALHSLGKGDRDDLTRSVGLLRRQNEQQAQQIRQLEAKVTALQTESAKRAAEAAAPKPTPPKPAPRKQPARRRR